MTDQAAVSLLRWLRRQLRQPTPQREHLEAAIANDDPGEARRLVALAPFTDAQRRHVEGLISRWEEGRVRPLRTTAIVERIFDAFARKEGLALRGLFAEDAVWSVPGDGVMAGSYEGREAIFRFLVKLPKETDGTYGSELIDVLASDDRAAALYRARGYAARPDARARPGARVPDRGRARPRGARAPERPRRLRGLLGVGSAA